MSVYLTTEKILRRGKMALWAHSSSIEILREEENTPWEVKYLLLEITEKKKCDYQPMEYVHEWQLFQVEIITHH